MQGDKNEYIHFCFNRHLYGYVMVHALPFLDGGRAVKVGDKLCLEPTIPTSAFVTARTGPHPCQVVSINERHHHFTAEFDFPEGSFRETYKEE